jgi:hypothetical protein
MCGRRGAPPRTARRVGRLPGARAPAAGRLHAKGRGSPRGARGAPAPRGVFRRGAGGAGTRPRSTHAPTPSSRWPTSWWGRTASG